MKEKTKKLLAGILEMFGYSSAIAYTSILSWLLYQVHKYGKISISEPNIFILLSEIGLGSGTIAFLIYKFLKEMKKRSLEL